jgi:hypothetical protein
MPYVSDKQRRFFNANRKKLESQGVDVGEWNASTKGKDLPEKAPMNKSAAAVLAMVLIKNLEKRAALQSFQPPVPLTENAGAQMASNVVKTPSVAGGVAPKAAPPATAAPATMTPPASSSKTAPNVGSTV